MGRYSDVAGVSAAGSRDQMLDHEGNFVLALTEGLIFPSQNNPREEFWKAKFTVLEFTPKNSDDGSDKVYPPGAPVADMASFLLKNNQGIALQKSLVQACEGVSIDALPQDEQEKLLEKYFAEPEEDAAQRRRMAGQIVRCRTYKKTTLSGAEIVARAWSPANDDDIERYGDILMELVSTRPE